MAALDTIATSTDAAPTLADAMLTYVDASSLCLMERYKIRKVWSTDHHLGLTGAEVLPRG